jgi:hypothetical protein
MLSYERLIHRQGWLAKASERFWQTVTRSLKVDRALGRAIERIERW